MNKIIALVFLLTTFSAALSAQSNEAVKAYIIRYQQLAVDEMIRTGVPAAITLAQGILESNAGQSDLVEASNNHFGIKCKSDWTGECVYHDDDTKGECFRSYSTPEDSYRDHSDFLSTRPNYEFLFNLDPTDYSAWAYGLKQARYATNPQYPTLLIKTIEDNDLEQYTLTAMIKSQGLNIEGNTSVAQQQSLAFKNSNTIAQPAEQTETKPTVYPENVFSINNTKVVYVHAGTSVYAVSKKYNISYSKLLQYNEMANVPVLNISQLVFLEKKPKKSSKAFHIVNDNETPTNVAQSEGIQLESLLQYNNLQKDDALKNGEKLALQSTTTSRKFARL